jgi:hypothetical protein
VAAARGEFIAFFDSDDIMLPGRIEKTVEVLENHPRLGLTFTNCIKFDEKNGKYSNTFLYHYSHFWALPKQGVEEDCYLIESSDAFDGLLYENFILTCGVTVPKKVFGVVGGFDEGLTNADDWDMWLRVCKVFPIGYVDVVGFQYRVREDSVSTRGVLLAENRIKVLKKRLQEGLGYKPLRMQAHKLIAENYLGVGYYYQSIGAMSSARGFYLLSLRHAANPGAFWGLMVSLMGAKLYRILKPLRDNMTIKKASNKS